MSQSGLAAGVYWPSNGISEVPFRVYTDQAHYAREQEKLFQGPTWNYLCLSVELAKPGDFVMCLGAGTITQWAAALPGELTALQQRRVSGSAP